MKIRKIEIDENEVFVLREMIEEFSDKNRHGNLVEEWGWDDVDIAALYSLTAKVHEK